MRSKVGKSNGGSTSTVAVILALLMLISSIPWSGTARAAELDAADSSYIIPVSPGKDNVEAAIGLPGGKLAVRGGSQITIYGLDGAIVRTFSIASMIAPRTTDSSDKIEWTALSNGNILIYWYSSSAGKGFTDTYFIVVGQDGQLVTAATKINNDLGTLNRFTRVAELSNGDLAFVWSSTPTSHAMRIFQSSGTARMNQVEVISDSMGVYTLDIAASPNGTFMVIDTTNTRTTYMGTLYQNDGTPINVGGNAHFSISDVNKGGSSDCRIISLSNGNYLVAYKGEPVNVASRDFRLAVFTPDGTRLSEKIVKVIGNTNLPLLTALADGGYLVTNNDEDGDWALLASKYDNNGNSIVSDKRVTGEWPEQIQSGPYAVSGYDSGFYTINGVGSGHSEVRLYGVGGSVVDPFAAFNQAVTLDAMNAAVIGYPAVMSGSPDYWQAALDFYNSLRKNDRDKILQRLLDNKPYTSLNGIHDVYVDYAQDDNLLMNLNGSEDEVVVWMSLWIESDIHESTMPADLLDEYMNDLNDDEQMIVAQQIFDQIPTDGFENIGEVSQLMRTAMDGIYSGAVLLDRDSLDLNPYSEGVTDDIILPATGENGSSITWSSDAPQWLDADGKVTQPSALEGDQTVTLTATIRRGTADPEIRTFTITVKAAAPVVVPVTGVTLDQTTLQLTAGGPGATLNATVAPLNATNATVTWSTSDANVAMVANGVVTPVGVGTATITATTVDGNYTATASVTVTNAVVPVTGVTLDQTTLQLVAGGAGATLNATVAPLNATNTNVTWSTSDANVATVANGVVTPIGASTATITATTVDGNYTATASVTVTNAVVPVTGVTLDKTTLQLIAGGAGATLNAIVAPLNATNTNVTWSTSDANVATVANGVVTPVGAGTATITATTVDGNYAATASVTVTNAVVSVTGVTLDKTTLQLITGGAGATLSATVAPLNATNTSVTWSTSDANVATVANGVVTPVGAGTATITATTVDGNYAATASVTVTNSVVPVTGVTLNKTTLQLVAGGAGATLNATVAPLNATNTNVTWSTSDANVATVANGVVTPVGAGTATITATTVDGSFTATASVTVTNSVVPVTGVTLNKTTLQLVAGGAGATLNAIVGPVNATNTNVTWSTSDANVATVANGVVTPVGVGTATITATTVDGNYAATASVTVTNAVVSVTGVTLNKTTLQLITGGAGATLSATVAPLNATNTSVTWSTSDANVATVANGVVTPVGAGTATITATTVDGNYSATASVTVTNSVVPVTGVTLNKTTLQLVAGGAGATLNATVAPLNATNANVTWSTSDANVATVANGVVTPVGVGTATITATTVDGSFTATASVTVTNSVVPVTGVTLNKTTLQLVAGGAGATLIATVAPQNATNANVTWSTSDANVATVANGVVTPVVVGTATITATTVDGNYVATASVTVTAPTTAPAAPTNVDAMVGDGQVTVTFNAPANDGGSEITGYEVTVSPGNRIVTATSSPIIISGLTNGISYTFTVKALNSIGASEPSAATSPVTPRAVPSNNSTPTPPSQPVTETDGVDVLVNGKTERAGTATTTKVNEKTVTTVKVDPKKLEDKLAAEGQGTVLTIPVNTQSNIVVGTLNGQMVKNMEQKQAIIEIKTNNASYTLPAGQINIDSISKQLGASVALQDIEIQVEIAEPAADTVKVVENSAAKGEFQIVVPPLDFTVKGVYGDQTVEVTKFNAYVERTIAIPDGVDPSKITTAIVVDPDGTVRHVPTQIIAVNGKYFAKISSLTNSTYSVVWHPITFADVERHWAKDAVNDMGSRMVISGDGNGLFNPDQDITRAEFAAIVVRALGLKLEDHETPFSDVASTDWFSGAVQTAYAYKLINGFEDGTFRPTDKITREQAMVIIAQAMKVTGLQAKLQQGTSALQTYTDADSLSKWAADAAGECLQSGIVNGRSDAILAPQAYISRAETAVIVRRLLQVSELI
ncbi:hypothetical protein GXP70_04840 [Paenibacillus lycopersici]|uniref:Uncharacterized protein n=1 Tax=Paenibacillus lycopersici TaxID=2704462 RepID=A0A6C0FV63_9BACL|nr:Ig-like domain-containing protein [Paenibacillus lycopersici]QHT59361.1 hypothetical protein GXP70_04840 [Paenibacillus lycopersici]